jgi:hypothetical protein
MHFGLILLVATMLVCNLLRPFAARGKFKIYVLEYEVFLPGY